MADNLSFGNKQSQIRRPSGPEPVLQRFKVNRVNQGPGDMSFQPEVIPEDGAFEITSAAPTRLNITSDDIEENYGSNANHRKASVFSLKGLGGDTETTEQSDKYEHSLLHFTREALPKMDYYRNLMSIQAHQRPTLDELHEEDIAEKQAAAASEEEDSGGSNQVKFSWVEGVLVRCLLNIWGVMLFLRLSWMVAECGIAMSMVIIALSTLITMVTTSSMSALATNGEIKGGGIYYLISRSLGPEFGGSIGVVFSFANAANASLNTVGFSESLSDLMKNYFNAIIVDGGTNDIRITGTIALIAMQTLIFVGMEWEAKCQVGLLVILSAAMIDYVVGAFMGPGGDLNRISKGFVGLNGETFMDNMYSQYETTSDGKPQSFFAVFSVFFPAVAGIQAGVSISGDLRDPSTAIPKGTMWAIIITSVSYAFFALLAGAGAIRSASGIPSEAADGSLEYQNCTYRNCEWGMYNNYQVMELMSAWGPLIYAGCFAATLSSALSCLVSCPKTFQALCRDGIYPYIRIFGKGYKNDDPYWGYLLTFVIALIFILIGDLDTIALLISNFFIAAYACVNFCTFNASLAKSVGWRPTYKYYNMWLSLLIAILCVVIMFLMSWPTALITLAAVFALYMWVVYRKPEANWGSSTQAQNYKSAITSISHLNIIGEHVKNYRPQILLLSGSPHERPPLVDFAYLISKHLSLLICAKISQQPVSTRSRNYAVSKAYNWFRSHKIHGFFVYVDTLNFEEGTRALMQSTGIGKLMPNIVMMGYKNDWMTCDREEMVNYFNVMHNTFDNQFALAIIRVRDGFDFSSLLKDEDELKTSPSMASLGNGISAIPDHMTRIDSTASQLSQVSDSTPPPSTPQFVKLNDTSFENEHGGKKKKKKEKTFTYLAPDGTELSKPILQRVLQFKCKQEKGTIDVWWLYDDGGLTLLLPYIIHNRRNWSGCKLRVFALSNKKDELELEQRSMASLLSKFRIEYSDLFVIPDVGKKSEDSTTLYFKNLIKDFRSNQQDFEMEGATITDAELLALKDKTNRHLRLRELLLEHSRKANMIVMTLPMPRKGTVSAPLYLAWLETITKDMPPFLLVRGNQKSVLTFYS